LFARHVSTPTPVSACASAHASAIQKETVVPAKAGTHFDFLGPFKIKMDPGFRRDDGGKDRVVM
jgi:hypothetical protein